MHIPDGFLSIPVSVGAAAISVGALAIALRSIKKKFNEDIIPKMGVLAAFIFAAQMFNFPVAGGTSGHLMGSVLAAIMVGPAAACVIMTVVLIVQCLMFQDGGILALGANVLNMAAVGILVGWAVYSSLRRLSGNMPLQNAAIFFGSWVSIVAAASACSLELAMSKTVELRVCLPAMVGIHSIIGIGEGLITLVVVSFVRRVRPEYICGCAQGKTTL